MNFLTKIANILEQISENAQISSENAVKEEARAVALAKSIAENPYLSVIKKLKRDASYKTPDN